MSDDNSPKSPGKENSDSIKSDPIKSGAGLKQATDEADKKKSSNFTLQARWEENFNRLLEYRKKHGHCLVPNRYPEDPQLGSWVSTQRRQYKILISGSSESTPMTPARASRLMNIGFEWSTKDPRHVPWESRFKELRDFVEKYGHAQVPIGWEDNVQLSNWVSTQRQEYKLMQRGRSSRLTEDRIKLLNDIGFVWEAQRGGPRRRRKGGGVPSPKSKEPGSPDSATNNSVGGSPEASSSPQPLGRGFSAAKSAAGGISLAAINNQSSQSDDLSDLQNTFENEETDAILPSATSLNGRSLQQPLNFTNDYLGADQVTPDLHNAQPSWAGSANQWSLFPPGPYQHPIPPPMPASLMHHPQGMYPVASPWSWPSGRPPMQMMTGMPPNFIPMNPSQRLSHESMLYDDRPVKPPGMPGFSAPEELMYDFGGRKRQDFSDFDFVSKAKGPKDNARINGEEKTSTFTIDQDDEDGEDEDPLATEKEEKKFGLFGSERGRSPTMPFKVQSLGGAKQFADAEKGGFDADIFADADESDEGL